MITNVLCSYSDARRMAKYSSGQITQSHSHTIRQGVQLPSPIHHIRTAMKCNQD